jgi:hypothetical protein
MSNARLLAIVAILAFLGWFIYLLAPVLTPFVIAALLAYIGNPAVSALERRHVPRVLSVTLVFVLFSVIFVGLMFILMPLLRDQIARFAARVPSYYDWAVTQLPRLESWLGISLAFDIAALREKLTEHWRDAAQWATTALGVAAVSGLTEHEPERQVVEQHQHHIARDQQEFIRHRIKDGAEPGGTAPALRDPAVQRIGHTRQNEHQQRRRVVLVL